MLMSLNNDDTSVRIVYPGAVNGIGNGVGGCVANVGVDAVDSCGGALVDKFYFLTCHGGDVVEICCGKMRIGYLRAVHNYRIGHGVGLHEWVGVVAGSNGEGCAVRHLQLRVAAQSQVAANGRLYLQRNDLSHFPL